MRWSSLAVLALLATPAFAGECEDELLKAVRKSDAAAVKALLDAGVSPNAKYRYDRPILSFAADRGNREIVEMLLAKGAEPNAKDTYYGMPPLVAAVQAGHVEVVRVMLAKGAEPASAALSTGLEKENVELVKVAAASGKLSADDLSGALAWSEQAGKAMLADALRAVGAKPLAPSTFKADPAAMAAYAGTYRSERGFAMTAVVENGVLRLKGGGRDYALEPLDATTFRLIDTDGISTVVMEREGDVVKALTVKHAGDPDQRFPRVEDAK